MLNHIKYMIAAVMFAAVIYGLNAVMQRNQ